MSSQTWRAFAALLKGRKKGLKQDIENAILKSFGDFLSLKLKERE